MLPRRRGMLTNVAALMAATGGGGGPAFTFVSAKTYNFGNVVNGTITAANLPAGMQAGDLLIVQFYAGGTSPTFALTLNSGALTAAKAIAAWDGASSFNKAAYYQHVLTSGDIANDVTFTCSGITGGLGLTFYVVRGPTAASFPNNPTYNTTNNLASVSGITTSGSTKGLVLLVQSRSTTSTTPTVTSWTRDAADATWTGGVMTEFSIAAGSYTSGSTVTVTSVTSGSLPAIALMCELT